MVFPVISKYIPKALKEFRRHVDEFQRTFRRDLEETGKRGQNAIDLAFSRNKERSQ